MVDRDESNSPRPREGFRSRDPDEEGPDQPRALRHADPVNVVERHASVLERGAEHRCDELEMSPGGDLRHDAAVPRVQVGL
jgi:hypothetical protein